MPHTANKQIRFHKMHADMLWYILGALVPAGIQLVKSPIFTRLYTPEEYGYYSIATSTAKYAGAVLFAWLASCMWRFYHRYRSEGRLTALYSNITFVLIITGAATLLAAWASTAFMDNSTLSLLILLCGIQSVAELAIGLLFIVMRLSGHAMLYNILQSARILMAFGLLCVLAFGYGVGIQSLVLSILCIDLLLAAAAGIFLYAKRIKIFIARQVGYTDTVQLVRYGISSTAAALGMYVLAASDRYLIAWYGTMDEVGIYNQIYNIGQITVVALVAVFFNTINPDYIKGMEYRGQAFADTLRGYTAQYLQLFLPLILLLSYFSETITDLLLGDAFGAGYSIMPYILFSCFFYGLAQFSETKLQFEGRFRSLLGAISAAAAFNIVANIVGIPVWGYEFAAISTLVSYTGLLAALTARSGIPIFSQRFFMSTAKILILFGCIVLADKFFLWQYGRVHWSVEASKGAVCYMIMLAALYPQLIKKLFARLLRTRI